MKKSMVVFIVIAIIIIAVIITLYSVSINKFNSKIYLQDKLNNFNGSIKEFNITAKQFSFEPEIIEVEKGDLVRIKIKSIDVEHGITIPEFKISETLKPGKETEIEFIADKTGNFNFFCNVYCGTGHNNMKGKLIVR